MPLNNSFNHLNNRDKWKYTHKELINLEQQGWQLIDDLAPFYEIMDYFHKTTISKQAKLRLKWFDYYHQCQNVAQTCKYFGISRKTFYKWKKRDNPHDLTTLKDKSKAPIKRRQREITPEQEERIIKLRKKVW